MERRTVEVHERRADRIAFGTLRRSTLTLMALIVIASVVELSVPRLGSIASACSRIPCIAILWMCKTIADPALPSPRVCGSAAIIVIAVIVPYFML